MSFWAFCCKTPQTYKADAARANRVLVRDRQSYLEKYAPSDATDNEGDWKCLSKEAGILSDGSLWCWISGVVSLHAHRRGLDAGIVRLGDDTDWKYVLAEEGRGFAIKEDGSLWAFGGNDQWGSLGIGLSCRASLFLGTKRHYARLSGSISSVSTQSRFEYTSRPTRLFLREGESPDDVEGGSGAVIDFDWSGYVHASDITVTSPGIGYTSVPEVRLEGVGDDEGITLQGSVTKMSDSSVTGFAVVSGGSGYSYATAYDTYSLATATAVIEDGSIIGWTLVDGNSKPWSLLYDKYPGQASSTTVVTGDGTGGEAAVVLSPSGVTEISFPKDEVWSVAPTVVFGSGNAQATVSRVRGQIRNARVANGGSGYPWTMSLWAEPAAGSVVLISFILGGIGEYTLGEVVAGEAFLSPCRVASVHPVTDANNYILSTASSGTVNTQSLPKSTTDKKEEIVSHGSSPVELTGSTPSVLTGYPFKPVRRTSHYGGKAFPGGARSVAVYRAAPSRFDAYKSEKGGYVQNREFSGTWPSSQGTLNVSGTATATDPATGQTYSFESTASFINIDGIMKIVESNGQPAAYCGYRSIGFQSGYGPVPYGNPPLFTGSVALYQGVTHVEHSRLQGAGSVWSPPTSPEVVRLYFSPPTHDNGEVPYAEIFPDSNGMPGQANIVEVGGLYTTPPVILSTTDQFPDPVRVGSQTWKDVSMSFEDGTGRPRSYGITTAGDLYWWGFDAANSNDACTVPAKVGQGVAVDISGGERVEPFESREEGWTDDLGQDGAYSAYVTRRSYVAPPQHGDRIAISPSLDGSNEGPERADSANSADSRWFRGSEKESFWRRTGVAGCGYTTAPAATFIQLGQTAEFSVSARLIGPAKFQSLSGNLARSTDGKWYEVSEHQTIVAGPRPFYSIKSEYRKPRSDGPFGQARDSELATNTRTEEGSYHGVYSWASHAGSNYTTVKATANFSALSNGFIPGPSETVWTESGVVNYCSNFNYALGETVIYSEKLPLIVNALGGAVGSVADVTSHIGLYAGSAAECRPVVGGNRFWTNAVSNSGIALTGDGTGAAVGVFHVNEAIESHLPLISLETNIKQQAGYLISEDGTARVEAGFFSQVFPSLQQGYTTAKGNLFHDGTRLFSQSGLNKKGRYTPANFAVTSSGAGYGEPPLVQISQQSGVATFDVQFDGEVSAIGVMHPGSGYSSAPAITLTANDGIGNVGTATAVIAGPVGKISVTNAGSGYRLPPKVSFSGPGVSPKASCALDANGGVESVTVLDGGRYRNSPPSVVFTPVVQVESLSLGSGGSGYSSAPDVFIGGGGGEGAAAVATICAEVTELELLSGGMYSIAPTVVIDGGGGTGATAECVLDAKVTSISVTNSGLDYTYPPTVALVGGGGAGATAVAELSGSGLFVNLTAQGSGYKTAPSVVFSGGDGTGATAIARILGPVDSVSLTSGGDCYRSAPTVSFVGEGGGAVANALISGYVDQLTLTERGKEYAEVPRVVFYNGGGGAGASATAAISGAGSGASGTAVLDGSIIYCTVSGSSGLQQEPSVSVATGTNFRIAELNEKLSSGLITQEEHEAQSKSFAAKLKSRISGIVTGITVSNGGSGYGPSTFPKVCEGVPAGCYVPTTFYEDNYATLPFRSAPFYFPCTVSSGGSILEVQGVSAIADRKFIKKPTAIASDAIAATAFCAMTLAGAAVTSSTESPASPIGFNYIVWDGVVSAYGVRSWPSMRRPYNNFNRWPARMPIIGYDQIDNSFKQNFVNPHIIAPIGSIYSYDSPLDWYIRRSGSVKALYYNPLPSCVVEDENGTGAAVSPRVYTVGGKAGVIYAGDYGFYAPTVLDVTARGSGYTLQARVIVSGGRPGCWSDTAGATANVSDGHVSSISVDSEGNGYNETPLVFLSGGGGVGAEAKAVVENGAVTSVRVINQGRGYTSSPDVIIVDQDKIFERSESGIAAKAVADRYGAPSLVNATVEFCTQDTTRFQFSTETHANVLDSRFNAKFTPFFADDGYVEDIAVAQMERGFSYRDFNDNTMPTVTVSGRCSETATIVASPVVFTDVFSYEQMLGANRHVIAKTTDGKWLPEH